MLVCKNVHKNYVLVNAVDGVDLELERGKIYALLGPNGSGKTTLMKIIAGLTKPTQGEILFEGSPASSKTKHHIAYMPTEGYAYSYMTCEDFGRYYEDFFNDFSMAKYLELLQDMGLSPKQKLSKLSSGMLAKCKVAVTLARNSDLIMLDEPLNGIDIIAREKIIHTIISAADENKTIMMSSHLVDELEKVVDNVIFMKSGKIVLSGSAEGIREEYNCSVVDMYKKIYS